MYLMPIGAGMPVGIIYDLITVRAAAPTLTGIARNQRQPGKGLA